MLCLVCSCEMLVFVVSKNECIYKAPQFHNTTEHFSLHKLSCTAKLVATILDQKSVQAGERHPNISFFWINPQKIDKLYFSRKNAQPLQIHIHQKYSSIQHVLQLHISKNISHKLLWVSSTPFSFIYRFNSRLGVLVHSSFANDQFTKISTTFQHHFKICLL